MLIWTVKKSDKQGPLLDFLQHIAPDAPVSYLRQLVRRGKVRCNGTVISPNETVFPGDEISLPASRRLKDLLSSNDRNIKILFESDEILIAHKPSGLATHAGKDHEQDNLVSRVASFARNRDMRFMLAPVHRLDLDTSGPVIFGKGKKATAKLGELLQQQAVTKRYFALVAAGLPASGWLASSIRCKNKNKEAHTSYRVLEQAGETALLELTLHTGRQHQIRKQLAEAGYPLAGDRRYRGFPNFAPNRLFLHCHLVEFIDPFSAQKIIVNDRLPEDLAYYLRQLEYRAALASAT